MTQRLLAGISKAVSEILPQSEKAFKKVQALFGKFKISLGLGLFQIELLQEGRELDAVDQIYSALTALADLATQEKKKLLFLLMSFKILVRLKIRNRFKVPYVMLRKKRVRWYFFFQEVIDIYY